MATINFHSQFNKTIAPFTISFVFVLLCTWGLTHKQLDITEFCIFFVGILFFGAGVLQGVVKLFSDKTQVSISEEGICDYRWSEIRQSDGMILGYRRIFRFLNSNLFVLNSVSL
jgi:hypothetical protein